MPTYANDPVRINLSWKDILNLRSNKLVKKGICLNFEVDVHNPGQFFLQASGVDTHPGDPTQEIYKEHIDKQLELLGSHIIQDRIRERYIDKIMPRDPTIKLEQRLDIKKFEVDNRYDVMLDKLTEKHLVFNGKIVYPMATIEGHHVIKKERIKDE